MFHLQDYVVPFLVVVQRRGEVQITLQSHVLFQLVMAQALAQDFLLECTLLLQVVLHVLFPLVLELVSLL